jgi:hypothetical protein
VGIARADVTGLGSFDVTVEAVSGANVGVLVAKLVADGFDPLVTRSIADQALVSSGDVPRSGPYVTITCSSGEVEIWDDGGDRHRVVAPALSVERVVVGHRTAQALARELATRLDRPAPA